MTLRILVSIPVSRNLPMCLQSIHDLQYDGEIRFSFERGGDKPVGTHISSPGRNENCLRKARIDQTLMLRNDFDAMLHIDDDMLIPPDTLTKLLALNSPVAYGLYTWRNEPHRWNICRSISDNAIDIYGSQAGDYEQTWGRVLEVAGVGTGCVLIRRDVLETVRFQLRGSFGYDYYFAVDCCQKNILQMVDASVICGHVDPENQCIYWPTVEGYRREDFVLK